MNFHWQQSRVLSVILNLGLNLGLSLGLSLAVVGQCQAQYVWLDEKGVKQFSDQPPPSNVPKNRIIKGVGVKPTAKVVIDDASASGEASAASASAHAASAPMTTAERNADYNKRRQEQAEKDKKQAEEAANNLAKRKNCEQLRDYQRSLDSGVRISNFDAAGNRGVMNDEQRAQATRENKQALADCK